MKNTFLKYETFLKFGIIKTTLVGTFLSITSSVIITMSILKITGSISQEFTKIAVIIAIIAPLIITPIVIVLFFKLIIQLQKALHRVRTLRGLLPICSSCKKIRNDKGYWGQIESYIEQHSDVEFSHGMCPDCLKDFYGNEDWFKKRMLAKK